MPTPIHYILWKSLPGGAESTATYYIEHFGKNHSVYLYSIRRAENKLSEAPGLRFDSGPENNLQAYLEYFRYCRRHRNHIFHLLSTGPITLLLALLAGVRQPVYHIHGTKYWKKTGDKLYLKTAWRIASLFQVHYVANSRYSAAVFQRDVLPVAPEIIYNGIDVARFQEKRHLRTQLRRMAFIGRLDPGKNVDQVIRLFESLAGEMPELELHIAGDGQLRAALETQAGNSPYAGRIVFHGWVHDVASFYRDTDLFVFPSAYESFGNVVAEALLTGLPVLTSDLPVFTEIFGDHPAFVLGKPADWTSFQRRFRAAVADYPRLAEEAYAFGEQAGYEFTLENHLEKIDAVYRKVPAYRAEHK